MRNVVPTILQSRAKVETVGSASLRKQRGPPESDFSQADVPKGKGEVQHEVLTNLRETGLQALPALSIRVPGFAAHRR